jgi:hypothetical protein
VVFCFTKNQPLKCSTIKPKPEFLVPGRIGTTGAIEEAPTSAIATEFKENNKDVSKWSQRISA